jgi:ABC-type nickel/cobalt efflux system permease component RcnA
MGNFTLNHTCILELTGNRIIHHALIDYAEVPSFEQFSVIDGNGDRVVTPDELTGHFDRLLPEIALNYDLKVGGKRLELRLVEYTPRLSQGVVGVTCIQILARLEGALPDKVGELEIQFENRAYANRMGVSNVRLLWSPAWEVTAVESIPSQGGQTVEPVADFENSLLLAGVRTVRFLIRSTGRPAENYQPVGSGFTAVDPYFVFNFIPQEILQPDAQGRYRIFHVKLPQEIVASQSVPALQPQALKAMPTIPNSMIGAAQDETISQTRAPTLTATITTECPKPGKGEPKYSRLIPTETISPATILAMILLSVVYGAAHALSPGRVKTIVAAHSVRTQGNLWKGLIQAVYLGVMVTLSQVFVVLAVGIIAMTLAAGALSAKATIGLQITSGVMVMSIGIPMIVRRGRSYSRAKVQAAVSAQAHAHPYDHSHDCVHHIPGDASRWDLLVPGGTGGMVPCLGVVVVFLIGIGYENVALGVTLVAFFSVGLAAVLIAIGTSMVLCRQLLDRIFNWFDTRFGRMGWTPWTFVQLGMPIVAAVFITLLGAGICIRALMLGGYLVIALG